MNIFKIIILVVFIIFAILDNINFMDTYSEEAKRNFRSEKGWKWGLYSVILLLILLI